MSEAQGPRSSVIAASAVGATALVVGALAWIEQRSPDFDPQYARDIVERSLRFGGTYYQNGIHNKGPLEPFLYEAATWFTTYDGYWFGIAAFVVTASIVLGIVASHIVRSMRGPRWLGIAAGAAVFIHLTLSGADYAGVLYSRNMTVTLLGIAFVALTPAGGWPTGPRRTMLRVAVAGCCLGLAVQTLQTAALSTSVVGVLGLVSIGDRGPGAGDNGIRRARWWLVAIAVATLASAPLYYAAVRSWRDFWDGWYVYGRYMSEATGRSLFEQLGQGWHQHYMWMQDHSPLVLAIVAFVVLGAARWNRLTTPQRRLHVALPLWYVAGWFEIILTQRFSSHYFVVIAVPAALMVVGLACHVVALIRESGSRVRGGACWVSATVVVSLVWSGTGPLITGLEAASGFRGVSTMAATRARGRDGTARSVQAVLDLVGDPGDSMLAWTNHPWPYLDFHRVSATRFIWKSFLMGEIYLGRTDLSYVLPGSWDRWTEDVSRTQPVVALLDATFPIPADTPFAQLLATDFSMALSTPTLSLSLRRDVMAKLSDDSTSAAWSGDGGLGAGWSKDGVGLRYDGVDLDESAAILDLGDLRCSRFDATIIGDGVSFHVLDPTGSSEPVEALMAGGEAITRSPNVEFLRLPIARRGADRISFIVGNESAVLLVNGVVGGALTLLPSTLIQVTSTGDTAALGDVRVGPAPVGGEC